MILKPVFQFLQKNLAGVSIEAMHQFEEELTS